MQPNRVESTAPLEFTQPLTAAVPTKQPLSFLSWFMQKGYAQGAFWATMICVVSVGNDILMRFLGSNLPVVEIIFFRFLFSAVTVLPIIFSNGFGVFATKRPGLHLLRALMGVGAIGACCYSVNVMPLSENTTIMFSLPLFFLPLAVIFLKETVDFPRWIATLIGFVGILIIMQPGADTFRLVALVPTTAAFLFAAMDIINKKMVSTESTYAILLYFAVGTALASAIPAFYFWQTPTLNELGLLVLLGIGANLIQVCIVRAFSATDASGLMPFRYVEFIFSAFFGFVLFSEIPTILTLAGAALIILGTGYISYCETQKEKKLAA